MTGRPLCGTDAGYRHHLRYDADTNCPPCRAAHSRAVKRRKLTRGQGYVDPAFVIAHVNRLRAAGMTIAAIAARAGVNNDTVSELPHRTRLTRCTADALLGVTLRPVPTARVARIGSVRRVQALMAIGWTHASMTAECGKDTSFLIHQEGALVTAGVAVSVAAMYDRLWDMPGPSRITAGRAARLGYLPPLAWDDDTIDDPDATPTREVIFTVPSCKNIDKNGGRPANPGLAGEIVDEIAIEEAIAGRPVRLTRAEETVAQQRMRAMGYSQREIAERLRIAKRTVERRGRAA